MPSNPVRRPRRPRGLAVAECVKRLFANSLSRIKRVVAPCARRPDCAGEPLESRTLLAATPLITEFLAWNSRSAGALLDQDGDDSDWIEIHNPGPTAINLQGWFLTDSNNNLDQWAFPSVSLPAGGYLVVFASGKNRAVAGQQLHTNFRLDADGGYLALVKPDGQTVVSSYSYPQQLQMVSYGVMVTQSQTTLINASSSLRVRIPYDNTLGDSWRYAGFDDAAWMGGTNGVGFDMTGVSPSLSPYIGTNVYSSMFNVNGTAYIRMPFSLEDADSYDWVRLRMRYEDGFVAYLNGQHIASRNAPSSPTWNSTAITDRAKSSAISQEEIPYLLPEGLLLEGNNVLAIQGLNSATGSPDFLIQAELEAVRVSRPLPQDWRYFTVQTPGGANNPSGPITAVADTRFSHRRGFYDEPFNLTIFTSTEGATIKYTLDGSAPSVSSGLTYTGPIPITTTTVLRAMAYKPGWISTNIDTQTYIFLNDVIRQSNTPAGYPTTWISPNGTIAADYGMDQNVVNNPLYRDRIINDLKSIPTLSIVTSVDNMFAPSPTGLYNHGSLRGISRERAGSVELINPDGSTGFQVDCGLRLYGNVGAYHSHTPKHSIRLRFDEDLYGAGKLNYPLFKNALFGDTAVSSFDTIVLRANFNNSMAFVGRNASYLQDPWSSATLMAMGNVGAHSTFVHLYINGLYWGLYCPTERPDSSFQSMYFGGNKDTDWDVNHEGEWQSGNANAWNAMMAIANGDMTTPASWTALKQYLDVDNLIDYLLLNFYGNNWDWDGHNYYFARKRSADGRFRFFNWDGEGNLDGSMGDLTNSNRGPITNLYLRIRVNPEFKMRFADRVHMHMYNNGPLTAAGALANWTALRNMIDSAIVGESARWGDSKTSPAATRQDWLNRVNSIQNTFQSRRDALLGYIRNNGLYPSSAGDMWKNTQAPEFSQHGGVIPATFQLFISNPSGQGTIYYTLDGTDPRPEFGGAPTASAQVYSGAVALAGTLTVTARVRLSDGTWSPITQAKFIGETSALRVTELMYNPPGAGDLEEFIELQNTGSTSMNLGGVSFTAGVTFTFPSYQLAPGARVLVVRNQAAFEARYGTGLPVAGVFTGALDNAGETIEIVNGAGNRIQRFTYNNKWHPITDGGGFSLVVIDTRADDSLYSNKDNWRPSNNKWGGPGAADPGFLPNSIKIHELMTWTNDPEGNWIELKNTTSSSIDLGGWYLAGFAQGASFTDAQIKAQYRFPTNNPAETTILPGGYKVLHQNSDFGAFFQLTRIGGQVVLANCDASGDPAGYREEVRFGGAELNVSFGQHWVSSAGKDYLTAMVAPTKGQANSAPRVGEVVISEIMYNPALGYDEWLELRNLTGSDLPLYDPSNPSNRWKISEGLVRDGEWVFPPGAYIPANGFALVVADDPAWFRNKYNVPAATPIYGPYSPGDLDNGGERLEIVKPGVPEGSVVPYITVDRVNYGDDTPWPKDADGLGPSLLRLPAQAYGNDGLNWTAGPVGGTPGRQEPPVVHLGPNLITGASFTHTAYFADYLTDINQTWTGTVSFGDNSPVEQLVFDETRRFTLYHFYPGPGSYLVTVTVTDSFGEQGVGTMFVTIPPGTQIGGPGNDDFRVRIDPADPARVQVWHNSTLSLSVLKSTFNNPLTVNLAAGNDTVTIDFTYGDPVPSTGLICTGDDGYDVLHVIGSPAGESLIPEAGLVRVGNTVISFNTIERLHLDGGGGSDRILYNTSVPYDILCDGGAGNDILIIPGSSGDDNVTFLPNELIWNQRHIALSALERVQFDGGTGNDTFTAAASLPYMPYVNGGLDNDTLILVGSPADDVFAANTYRVTWNGQIVWHSAVEMIRFEGGAGNDTVTIAGPVYYNAEFAAGNGTADRLRITSSDRNDALVIAPTLVRFNLANIAVSDMELLEVASAGGNDAFSVSGVIGYNMTLDADGGTDSLVITDTAGNPATIISPTQVQFGGVVITHSGMEQVLINRAKDGDPKMGAVELLPAPIAEVLAAADETEAVIVTAASGDDSEIVVTASDVAPATTQPPAANAPPKAAAQNQKKTAKAKKIAKAKAAKKAGAKKTPAPKSAAGGSR